MNWRPIATAPRDRFILLCYRPNPCEERVYVHEGKWVDTVHANEQLNLVKAGKPQPDVPYDGHWEIGYIATLNSNYGDSWEARSFRVRPTHWMPLPAPKKL